MLGEPIKVCSAHYPKAAQEAIKWWNNALGVDVFTWTSLTVGDSTCPVTKAPESHRGVGSLIIYDWVRSSNGRFCEPACLWDPELFDKKWHTWYGRMEILVTGDADGDGTVDPGEFHSDIADPKKCAKGSKCHTLVAMLAHELGHALSFADRYRYEDRVNKPADPSDDRPELYCASTEGGSYVVPTNVVSIMCYPYD